MVPILISGTLADVGNSASAGLGGHFNISLSGTWAGTVILQRAFPEAQTTWLDVKSYTANIEETGIEPEAGMLYRIRFAVDTSGTVTYRLSQNPVAGV